MPNRLLSKDRLVVWLGTALLALAACATTIGCSSDRKDAEEVQRTEQALEPKGQVIPIDSLPFVEPLATVDTFLERLSEPTASGENVALHLKLPPPSNQNLSGSLVRVLGEPSNPLVVFRSDALVRLGRLRKSPGREFFTAFLSLDDAEIERRAQIEKDVGSINKVSDLTLLFKGRTPVAVTSGVRFDAATFFGGGLVALGRCPIKPASVLARWNESLMVTNPLVVQDSGRTNDACAPGGDPNGVWTFKHLMSEMAIGSGLSTHDFVLNWLKLWLNPYVVNGDTVPARTQMFSQVIQPWAIASGVTATLSSGSPNVLTLSGPLNLDIAPFRLSAIVNRIDLGNTVSGPSGYGGKTTALPLDAGELRFVFGVQNLSTCAMLRFSVILEYGVPITGCSAVRDWAAKWTKLNDPAFAAPFTPAWRAFLETLTESVVLNGAAPAKGNKSAINQVRTNEIPLGSIWELREFRLTKENTVPPGSDPPANGPLRPHTVAMTPNDGPLNPAPHLVVDQFVNTTVLAGVPPVVPLLPDDCSASYAVPGSFPGPAQPFRGGNAFTLPPTHWEALLGAMNNRTVCARHEFSKNTCNGCHFGDTATTFLHVDPTVMPAALSNFLTGAGGIWSVPDTQFGVPNWTFADLDHRFDRLYEIACAECGRASPTSAAFVDRIVALNGSAPIDPVGPITDPPFRTGPVTSLQLVDQLLAERGNFVNPKLAQSVELDGFVRPVETFVH